MAPGGSERRFPRSVYAVGSEPDARVSLANERTFLAWVRTGLALTAGGVALEALDVPVAGGLRLAAALVLVVLGTLAPALAWSRWAAVERAARLARPLPASVLGPVVALGTTLAAALLLVGLALG
ncbi:YidH family protein [Blastococcus sp. SYSU D01050]